ncbi:MAG: PDZ domain-containing protein [Chloroflexi bacterium]|nr:PDZ domain-containing protein [Chloroflexota bacterium]MQC18801.1 PDZ domain-containing protein [Chloroflexota bacterium]
MNYVQRNLLPLILGMLAVVAIIIGVGSLIVQTGDGSADEQLEREAGRRGNGAMHAGNPTLAAQLDAELRVTEVVADGPGGAAGLRTGDRIVAVNDQDVTTMDEARTRLAAVPPSAEFTLSVNREGARVDLKVHKAPAMAGLGGLLQRLTERAPQLGRGDGRSGAEAPSPSPTGTPAAPTQGPVLGVSLQPVPGGLKVLTVMTSSPAASAGLVPDDVIVSANGRASSSVDGLQVILRDAGHGASVALSVKRGDQQITLTATLGPRT